jgi:ABC-type Fe3+ transport system substrate-binding protein
MSLIRPTRVSALLIGSLWLAACASAAPQANPSGSAAQVTTVPSNQSVSKAPTDPPKGTADLASLAAAAQAEGKVVVSGPPGPLYRPTLVDEFQRTYPSIAIEFTGSPGAPEATKLVQERAAGLYSADVYISGTTNMTVTLKEAGAVDPLPPLLLPEVLRPEVWYEGKLQWADGSEPMTTLMFECYVNEVVFVNPKIVDAKQFTSMKDLLDPKWKGKIAGTDIRQPGPGGVPSRFIYKHSDLGPDYLTQLFRDTNIVLSSDQRQLIDWVAQGTYPIGIFLSGSEVLTAEKQGLPITLVPPEQFKEGGAIGPGFGGVSIMNRAPHPNAARLYVNWLLSAETQRHFQTTTGEPSCRADVPTDDVPASRVPKPGQKYVNAGTEEYSRLTGNVMRDLITAAIEARPK